MKNRQKSQLTQAKIYFNRGDDHRRNHEYPEALDSFERAISLDPNYAEAHWKRGNILLTTGRPDDAVSCYKLATAIRGDYPEAYHNLGIALQKIGDHQQALANLLQAIELKPDYASAYNSLGIVYKNLDQQDLELACYRQAIALHPEYAEAYNNMGNAHKSQNRPKDALDGYRQAIHYNPGFVQAYANCGKVQHQLAQYQAAIASFDKALSLDPKHADSLFNLGQVYNSLRDYEKAAAHFRRFSELQPENIHGYMNLGIAQKMQGQFRDAEKTFLQAVKIQPKSGEAYFNLGLTYHELRKYEKALSSYEKAYALLPGYAESYHNNRGNTLFSMQKVQEALACFDQALAINPAYHLAHLNRGIALQFINRHQDALACFQRVAELVPNHAEAHGYSAIALNELKRYREALQSFDLALTLNPDFAFLRGLKLMCQMQICDWHNLAQETAQLCAAIVNGQKNSPPFPLLAVTDNAAIHKQAAKIWGDAKHPPNGGLGPLPKYPQAGRIRIGYFSADFRVHPVGLLIAELIELHDRERFEIIAFSLDPVERNPVTDRLRIAFDQFLDIHTLSDLQAAELVRNLKIDIAVDLSGYTQRSRPDIFALRAAPLQIGYLGYPGTLAADYTDYLIADKIVIPDNIRGEFSEKIIYLPHSYLANDSTRPISGRPMQRRDFGLPEHGTVYACFNNSYKINPQVFGLWMQILQDVPGSVLWLSAGMDAHDNLRNAARTQGVDPNRIVFARRLDNMDEHLARQRLADLFLDCLPYNAHTTACDALWAGLPVLTLAGNSFPARVAASLLNALEMPELITHNQTEYRELAAGLGQNPPRLDGIKRKLQQNRSTAPLFNTRLFAKHLESAYRRTYRRHHEGLAPQDLTIAQSEEP